MAHNRTFLKSKKGQASIEFIFLVLIIVIYLITVARPVIDNAKTSIYEIERISRANNETQKLADAISRISFMGEGSKETIYIYMPTGCNEATGFIGDECSINCYQADKTIGFSVTMDSNVFSEKCHDKKCDKNFILPVQIECFDDSVIGTQKVVVERLENRVKLTKQ